MGGLLVLFIYITRLASNEIFSPSNKTHWEVGQVKDLSASQLSNSHFGTTDIKRKKVLKIKSRGEKQFPVHFHFYHCIM
jgi:hypothetical protein